MEFSDEFLARQRQWLVARLESTTDILKEGGERAQSLSTKDLALIRIAIKRIDERQYGICLACGCLIDHEKLSLIPETPICADCASERF
jgi:RNA polymerase-binding transcription factor DksA